MYLDKKIPIIVLNYNDYETSHRFLDYFKKELAGVLELIFVDNNSTDGSYEALYKEFSSMGVFIRNDENKGYGSGNNIGLKFVKDNIDSERVIISNPDIMVSAETIMELSKAMDDDKSVKAAAPKMLNERGEEQVSAWKLQGAIRDGLSSMIVTNRLFKLDKKLYSREELSKERLYVEALNGSFFMADMRAFAEIGFFDEDTFLYCEENIIGYKMREHGYRELLVNNVSYIHAHNKTIGKIYSKKYKRYKILQNSRKIYYTKYLKINRIKLIIFNIMSAVGTFERKFIDKLPIR